MHLSFHHLQEKIDCGLIAFDPVHVVLFAEADRGRFPLVKIFLSGHGLDLQLALRCDIIDHCSHQVSTQSGLTTLQELLEAIAQSELPIIGQFTIFKGMLIDIIAGIGGLNCNPSSGQ